MANQKCMSCRMDWKLPADRRQKNYYTIQLNDGTNAQVSPTLNSHYPTQFGKAEEASKPLYS